LALSAAGRKLSRVAGGPAPATREQILVDAATIQTLAEYWTRVRLRPPTCEELRGLVDDHVRRSASSMTTAEFIPGKVGDQSRKRNRHEHEQDADAAVRSERADRDERRHSGERNIDLFGDGQGWQDDDAVML